MLRTPTFLLASLLLSAPSFGASLECVSYSKAYDLVISVTESRAKIQVLRAEEKNTFSLTKGEEIVLARADEHHRDYARFEGLSQRPQHLTFSGLKAELNRAGALRTSLAISADWTDTTEVMHQLDCVNK